MRQTLDPFLWFHDQADHYNLVTYLLSLCLLAGFTEFQADH
jgi:hypothetical protein